MKFNKKEKNRSKPNNIFAAFSVFVVIKQASLDGQSKHLSSHLNRKVLVCQLLQQDSFMCWTKL